MKLKYRTRVTKNRFLLILLPILIFYFISFLSINSSNTTVSNELLKLTDCNNSDWKIISNLNIESNSGCPSAVDLFFAVNKIDLIESKTVDANIRLYPSGEFGGSVSNGGWTSKSLELTYEGQNLTSWQMLSNTLIGARSLSIPLKDLNNLKNYPFDSYSINWSARLENDVSGDPVPTFKSASIRGVPGYSISIKDLTDKNDVVAPRIINFAGITNLLIEFSRSGTHIFLALLLALIMIIGALSAVLMSLSIFKQHRPPSLSALGWLATFLFALVEMRANLPGEPPLGINFDLIVTFPLILIVMILIVLNAVLWMRREDWDMENHDPREFA
jgi:hypothetical protein